MVLMVNPARVPKREESKIVAIDVASVLSVVGLIGQSIGKPVMW